MIKKRTKKLAKNPFGIDLKTIQPGDMLEVISVTLEDEYNKWIRILSRPFLNALMDKENSSEYVMYLGKRTETSVFTNGQQRIITLVDYINGYGMKKSVILSCQTSKPLPTDISAAPSDFWPHARLLNNI